MAATIGQLKKFNWLAKEIIVSDGGSTDRTVEIAKAQADKVFVRKPGQKNKSIAENRNKGASLAAGEILFFLDCGVIIGRLDEFIRAVLSILSGKTKIVGLTLEMRFYQEQARKIDQFNLWAINKGIGGLNKIRVGAAMGWVQVVRRQTFQKIGGYNENLISQEDMDLFRRLNKLGRTVVLKNYLAYGSPARYQKTGWPKMVWIWFLNTVYYLFAGKSHSKEW